MEKVVFDGTQPKGDVGHFRYDATTDEWSWSDGMYAIHGYAPGEVPASTGVLVRHKHPDDRERAAAVLEDVLRDGGFFSCYHRVVDQEERVRSVLSVGRAVLDDATGAVVGVDGFFVDLTTTRRTETEAEVQKALVGVTEHRAVIDQAIGMVMSAVGCGSDEAFEQLRRCSHHANIKLHDVAQQLVDVVGAGPGATGRVLEVLDEIVASAREQAVEPASSGG